VRFNGRIIGGVSARAMISTLAMTTVMAGALSQSASRIVDADPVERRAADLLAQAGPQRFTESRLNDFDAWGEPPSPARGAAEPATSSTRVPLWTQIAALRLREVAERSRGLAARRRVGIAYLALGDPVAAASALEDAAAVAPTDVATHVDLSAALIERWRERAQPADLCGALEAAGLALRQQPASRPALFNQALALEKLGLRRLADEAWQAYLRHDTSGPWAIEAGRRREGQQPPARAVDRLPPANAGDAAFDAAVAENPLAVYRYLEHHVLPAWAGAVASGRTLALDMVPVRLADALQRADRDAYLQMLLQQIHASASWPAARRQDLAHGIDSLLRWRDAIDAGDYQGAEPVAARASAMLTRAGVDPIEADFERGYSALVSGQRAQAVQIISRIETRATQRRYWRIAARAARLRALDAMMATRVSEAQTRYEGGLVLANRSGDAELSVLFHTFLAEALGQQGDVQTAWQHLAPTFALVDDLHSMRQRFDVFTTAAVLARRTGNNHAALLFADELLRATRDWNNPEGAIAGRLTRARAMADLQIGDQGASDLDRAEELLPQLGSRPQAQERLRAEVNAYRAFSLAGSQDRAALAAASSAIAYFEQSVRIRLAELLLQRGRIHKHLGDLASATADWTRGVQIVEDQRPALRNELLRIARTAAFWDLFGELIDGERHDPRAALALAERAKARELVYSLAPDQTPQQLSLAGAQALLSDGAQMVVFSQLRERLLIWIVDADSVRMIERSVSPVDLRDLAQRFVHSLESDDDREAGDQLADLVLPAGLRYRVDRPIIFVPDGVLHAIPFAALPVPGQQHLLVEVAIPVVAPSVSAFVLAANATTRESAPSLLAIGVDRPATVEGLPPLPYVARETATVASFYGGRTQTLVGPHVSTATVTGALHGAAIVHFAGHAVLDPLFPARSRLVLSDGALTGPEIAAAGVRPGATIVLSACDTAAGQIYRGEGPMSLVRSFFAAGAATVVATLWKVRDDDAFRLMTLVHRSLAEGVSASESLARAQRQLIALHAERSSWAGFAVMGSGQIRRKDS
jgi:CHAT domain-containing protein